VCCSHSEGQERVSRCGAAVPSSGRCSPGGSAASDSTVTSDPGPLRKPVGMLIRGFPARSSNSSVREGLYHEYKKYGKVTAVHISGTGDERQAIVSFKK